MKRKTNRGVTLVEIAIVLVIIGLLLGGILKGQELINNAKVRAISDQQGSLKVAWYSFVDRFQAQPGDFINAQAYLQGAAGALTAGTNVTGDGVITEEESPIVFQNLAAAGYIRCPQCKADAPAIPNATNSLFNTYSGVMSVFHTTQYALRAGSAGTEERLLMNTGPRIPSNIISQVDAKLDDGVANTGDFTFSPYDPNGTTVPVGSCTSANGTAAGSGALTQASDLFWRNAFEVPLIFANCGAHFTI